MEEDLLHSVIKVEKEIQQTIEAEKKKAADWLESLRVSLRQELEDKKKQLTEEYDQSLELTCRECRLNAEKEISDVNQMAERIQNLPEKILLDLINDHLQLILPLAAGKKQ